MNKKLLSVILSSAIVAGALVGCSGKSVSLDSKKNDSWSFRKC